MANTSSELSSYPLYEDDPNDPEAIRLQIAHTRAQMGNTIDQIQARLAPEHLKQQAQEAIREATIGRVEEFTMNVEHKARSMRSGLMHTIRENPIPAALVGIGLGWLMMSNRDDDDDIYYQERDGRRFNNGGNYRPYYTHYPIEEEPGRMESARTRASEAMGNAREAMGNAGEAVDTAQERVGDMAQQAQERTGSLVHDAREQVRQTADHLSEQAGEWTQEAQSRAEEMRFQTRMGVYRAKRTFSDTLEENPLALAAAALAAGALVGMALPSTPIEDQWLGETRDRVMDEAKSVAQDTAQKVQHVAQEAGRAAVDEAKYMAEEEGLTPPQDSTSTPSTTSTTESWSSS